MQVNTRQQAQDYVRDLLVRAVSRSNEDQAAVALEELASVDVPGLDPDISDAHYVALLRLRAMSYALAWQADMLKTLVDEVDLGAALDCAEFSEAMLAGALVGSRVILAPLLPEHLP